MSDIRQVADGLKALEKQYRAVLKAGEFLSELADLDQVKTEAERAAAKAVAERDAAEQALKDIGDVTVVVRAKLAAADAEALARRGAAKDDADNLILAARHTAIAEEAKAQARLDALNTSIFEAGQRLELVDGDIAAAKSDLAQLEGSIAALRAQAAKVAGGA